MIISVLSVCIVEDGIFLATTSVGELFDGVWSRQFVYLHNDSAPSSVSLSWYSLHWVTPYPDWIEGPYS